MNSRRLCSATLLTALAAVPATLSLFGIVPIASAQTPWRERAATGWEAREGAGRFLPDASPWWWDLPVFPDAPVGTNALFRSEQPSAFTLASALAGPQPQAAGQDLYVTSFNPGTGVYGGATYTVSGNEQWANVHVGYGSAGGTNNGAVTQNANTTMTINGVLSLADSYSSSGTYTLNGGTLSAASEQISNLGNGGGTFTQGGGINSVGSGGVTLSHVNPFGSAIGTGTYNLNGGTLSTPFVANGGGASSTFNFNGGTLQATGNNTGFLGGLSSANIQSGGAFINPNGYAVTVSQALGGSGGLTQSGAGTLTLTGTNTYTGSTAITAGTLTVGGAGTLGAGSYAGNLADAGAFLYNSSAAQTLSGVVLGAGTLTQSGAGALTLTGTNTYTGATSITAGTLTVGGAGTLGSGYYGGNIADAGSFVYNSSAAQTLVGVISGTGTLTVGGTGTLTLYFTSTYTGNTTVNAGTLETAYNTFSVGAGATLAIGGTGTVLTRSLQVQGTSASPAAVTLAGNGTLQSGYLSVGDSGPGSFTQSGGTLSTGGYLLVVSSSGVYALSGGSASASTTYIGGTFTQSGGTLTTDSLLLSYNSSNGTYNLNGGTLSAGAIQNAGTLNFNGGTLQLANNILDAQAVVQAGGAIIDSGSNNPSIFQNLTTDPKLNGAADGGLTKLGPGTLTLTGANTYTGATTISDGTLLVGGTGTLGTGNYAGAIADAGNFTYNSSADQTLSGVISGAGTLTQAGPGTLTLTGNDTYTGATTISGGTLLVGGTGTLGTGNYAGAIADAGSFVYNSSAAQTLTGVVSGAGSLTQAGPGTLTLTGANTYTGATTVTAGTLSISGSGSLTGTSALTLNNGGTLSISGNGAVTNPGSATVNNGGTLAISGSGSFTNAPITINSGGTLTVGDSAYVNPDTGGNNLLTVDGTVRLSGGTLSSETIVGYNGNGVFTQSGGTLNDLQGDCFIGYNAGSSGTYNLSAGNLNTGGLVVGYVGTGVFNQTGGTVSIYFPSRPGDIIVGYNGTVGTLNQSAGTLSASRLFLGLNPGGTGTYNLSMGSAVIGMEVLGESGGTGTFNQSGGTNTVGTLYVGVGTDSTNAYNLDGGTLNLGSVNGTAGASGGQGIFHFNGGTLQASASDVPGTRTFFSGLTTADVGANGAIVDTNGYNVTMAQTLGTDPTLNGATDGGLTKLGAGTLTLTAANTYTGATTVSAGILLAANPSGFATGTGAVMVGSGGTLGGNGTLSGAVTVQSGGTLAPGALAVSRLTLGSTLTLQNGSTLAITLGGTTAGSGYDQVQVYGNLTLAGTLNVRTVNGFTLAVGNTFTILDNTNSTALTTGTFSNALGTLYTDAAGQTFSINYLANSDGGLIPNDVTLTYLGQNVVPEPSTWACLSLGAGLLALTLRGRRVTRPA